MEGSSGLQIDRPTSTLHTEIDDVVDKKMIQEQKQIDLGAIVEVEINLRTQVQDTKWPPS